MKKISNIINITMKDTNVYITTLKNSETTFFIGDSPTVTFNNNVTVYAYPKNTYFIEENNQSNNESDIQLDNESDIQLDNESDNQLDNESRIQKQNKFKTFLLKLGLKF